MLQVASRNKDNKKYKSIENEKERGALYGYISALIRGISLKRRRLTAFGLVRLSIGIFKLKF